MEPIAALRAEALARANHAHAAHHDHRIRGPRLPRPRNHLKDRLLVLLGVRTPAHKGAPTGDGKGACC